MAPWVNWTTYAAGAASDKWVVSVSKGKMKSCQLAKHTATNLVDSLPFEDGSGFKKINWQGYAITVGEGRSDDPIGHDVPSGWKCFALPSIWGTEAWYYAELGHLGVPNDEAFGPASGPTAGGGYCESGAHFDASGVWHGGTFFSWVPDTQTCGRRYKLKETPVPDQPGEVTYPAYGEAQVPADYELLSC